MTNQIKLFKVSEQSKQINDNEDSLFWQKEWVIDPSMDFDTLLYAYENSSTISWIVKKIANAWNVWFQETDNVTLNAFLKNLDVVNIFSNMLIFWNSFSERLSTLKDQKTLDFEPIITTTIRIASKNNKDNAEYYQRSKKGLTKVPFTKDEVLFFKTNSVGDKYYGDSIFYTCIDEITLLAFITKYYKNFFKGGNIEPNVLYDESWSLNDEQIDKIENLINDKISWIDNSHNTVFAPGKIWKIDLTTKIEPDKFIALKRELKEDIAIATNIPFSLLSPENSNKAISQTDINSLYSDIVIPLHNTFLIQLKKQLKDWKIEWISDSDIDDIKFEVMSLKDWLEEMKILTWYQKSWVLNANEVRQKAWLWDAYKWWDEFVIHSWSKDENTEDDSNLTKVEEEIKKMYWWDKRFLKKTTTWWDIFHKIWLWKNK